VLKVRAGGYSIELANPRHEHEWRLWETLKLPKDAVLIPVVISHATNIVEHPELVAERIVRLARLVGRENVIASTDCGFAQVTYFARVHPQIMWAKLEALVEGARLASWSSGRGLRSGHREKAPPGEKAPPSGRSSGGPLPDRCDADPNRLTVIRSDAGCGVAAVAIPVQILRSVHPRRGNK